MIEHDIAYLYTFVLLAVVLFTTTPWLLNHLLSGSAILKPDPRPVAA